MTVASDSLADLQAAAIRFRDERDWAQFHTPKDLALGLTIEAGELAELFLWKTAQQSVSAMRDDFDFRQRLADELAAAVREKIAKNAGKYPVEKARGNAVKYTEL